MDAASHAAQELYHVQPYGRRDTASEEPVSRRLAPYEFNEVNYLRKTMKN